MMVSRGIEIGTAGSVCRLGTDHISIRSSLSFWATLRDQWGHNRFD